MIRTRSNFLVHWTGKDLLDCDIDEGIQQHVDRLASIYRAGLHLSVPPTEDNVILAYCKPMNRKGEENLSHYEDHEWRIIQSTGGIPLPPEFKQEASGKKMSFHFDHAEVQVIIFPNYQIRTKALANGYLSDILKTRMPMMLDHDACSEL